jgi:hypothetical protein
MAVRQVAVATSSANPTFPTGVVILAFCVIFSRKCESDQWGMVRKRV